MTSSRNTAKFPKCFRLWGGLVIAALSPFGFGWSEAGHTAIAEIAMRQLTPSQYEQLDLLARPLAGGNAEMAEVGKNRAGLSAVARTAAWLDRARGITLEELFRRNGASLPAALTDYADQTTDNWHYDNIIYAETGEVGCTAPGGELVDVLPLLQEAFATTREEAGRMVVLAMLVHLVGDAHQPLHAVTRAQENCEHDRGGNGFCIAATASGCDINLHQLWDGAFGLFEETALLEFVDEADSRLRRGAAVGSPSLQPAVWQVENLVLAERIYSVAEGRRPEPAYYAWGQAVARQKMLLAAERLAAILEGLVPRDGS